MIWTHENVPVTSIKDMPIECGGFIYKLTYIKGDDIRFYIGKKNIKMMRTMKKGKKELAKIKDKRGSKKKIVCRESNWATYESSSKDIPSGYTVKSKEILEYCESKKKLTYLENKYLYGFGVLESDKYFNSNISGKFFPRDM